jgi:putative transposase
VRRAHLSTASRSPHLLRSLARAPSTRGPRDAEVVALIAEVRDARSGSGSCLWVVAASARTSRDVARSTERLMTAPGSASALAWQEGPHHHRGRGGCAAGCSGRPGLHPNCAEPAVGRGLHLRFRPGRARSLGPSSFDVFSRRVAGWMAATSMSAELVFDTLETGSGHGIKSVVAGPSVPTNRSAI